ncbi:MAG: hypothetical protein H7124_03935 [Phycisphaerales bacterium]|nr:hypothetical protein [Hyphomonadaceae bacterium]
MSRMSTHWAWVRRATAAAAAIFALSFSAHDAAAQQSPLVGYWECTGQTNGVTFFSTFDYRANGTYVSTQRMSVGADLLEGGGNGRWRLDGDVLFDTKEHATMDRFVRNGVEVLSSDPEWQQLYRQSQANIGTTSSGPIILRGDALSSGMYTCHRQRRLAR